MDPHPVHKELSYSQGSQSNEPAKTAKFVQHFVWGSSLRHKGTARHVFDIVWLYRTTIPVRMREVFYFSNDF
jgi:hypothetical protein